MEMLTHEHAGPLFREFIRFVIKSKCARSYLEVGVRDGSTLALVDCPSIGVDPAFDFKVDPVGGKEQLHLFKMTSDKFFRDHDPRKILQSPVDVVFLDGLHQFEFLLRDFMNSEAVCHPDSLIMLDDCLPVNAEMTERYLNVEGRRDKDRAGWWTGDVWKMLPVLNKYRPDLKITPVNTSPTGNICITNLDPGSQVLRNNYYDIIEEFVKIEMDDDMLRDFYQKHAVVDAATILRGFEASRFIGR